MDQRNRRGWANHRLIGSLVVLALGLVLLSACGNGAGNNTNSTRSTNKGSQTGSTSNNMNPNVACDQMTKVAISEHSISGQTDQYFFTPDRVTIKAGEFITFSNQSDEVYVLASTPNAALANIAIDRNENQPVQFTKAGTYTLESQNARHRVTMHVTVTAATGTTCGISAPDTTITFTVKHTRGQPTLYALTPKTVNINAGQSLAFLNKTDRALTFACKPSADMTEGNLRVDTNEQQIVQFTNAGQYTCTSTTIPRSTLAVNVH